MVARQQEAVQIQIVVEADVRNAIRKYLNSAVAEGHSFVPKQSLCEDLAESLEITASEVEDSLVELAVDGEVRLENLDERTVVFPMACYLAEQKVCKKIFELASARLRPIVADIDGLAAKAFRGSEYKLSERQALAVRGSLLSGVYIITGGPGTGKTTIIKTIMQVAREAGLAAAIAAPTGRAAKRICETSPYEAKTMHRLLECAFIEETDEIIFRRDADNPLDEDLIIIDEASMVDVRLMASLLDAMVPGQRLILVGDADQLPPVGAGAVLRDLLESDVLPCTRLAEIYRQAKESLIVVNAHSINRGDYPVTNESDRDFYLLTRSTEKEIRDTLADLLTKRLPAYYSDLDPLTDIQLLTPVKKGALGTESLNALLRNLINPPAEGRAEYEAAGTLFREGDKVMQIKNNYRLEWKRIGSFEEGSGVFNGDVGFVQHIDPDLGEVTVVFDDRCVVYEPKQLAELELAYAITVHKSQGSEFPVVLMPVSYFPPMLATRNLLYTAVTRGREAVILVGSETRLRAMVDNNANAERNSGLAYRLRKIFEL